ncbi:hypothetical protein B4N89_43945 [Embleya scabrispora]|uniref:Uncharacterized protein n=1 Tax=Embleya scabrispora TaxID=159449 RepID=A0A1T3NKR1_9ACTN|nr:hypothetical protein [Embleya scabrispora]OPC77459.1 hypothetical protein B4N89_43945 [Embleya scabrispora]
MAIDVAADRPVVLVEISADHSVRVAGEVVVVSPGDDPRGAALAVVAERARLLGQPVRVHAREADGTIFPLDVYADRSIAEAGAPIPAARRRGIFGLRRPGSPSAAEPTPAEGAPPATVAPGAVATPVEAGVATPSWTPPRPAANARPPAPAAHAFGAGVPVPGAEQRRLLDLIRAAMGTGDHAGALTLAAELDSRTGTTAAGAAERLAAREVHGYVALATGHPEVAVRLYAEAATLGDGGSGEAPARMAANAHFCWLRVTDPVAADAAGALVLHAYAVGGAADSPGARAARRRLTAARTGS